MTLPRIKELESLGFGWGVCVTAWEVSLTEFVDYRKIYGHCNVPKSYCENTSLANWVGTQRMQYKLQQEGKNSFMTLPRIKELESLGFEWGSHGAAWEDHLSELADYRKIHGHCNVPKQNSGNAQLSTWILKQREQYRLRLKGMKSHMTLPRIKELESLGSVLECFQTAWDDRLSELAD